MDEKSSPNATLAKAVLAASRSAPERVESAAQAAVAQACLDILEFAKGFDPEVKKGFDFSDVETSLKRSESRPGLFEGKVMLRRSGVSVESSFVCSPEQAELVATQSAIRSMMEEHPWFSEGMDLKEMEGRDEDMSPADLSAVSFARGLDAIGPAGRELSRMLALESAWSGPRWSAQMDLQSAIAEAARAGLFPAAFETTTARLIGGWPGEPTLLASLRVGDSHFRHGHDAVESLSDKAPGGDWAAWELPSLVAGREALWEAFCQKAALAQDLGWSSLSVGQSMEGERESRHAAAERELLGETTATPSTGLSRRSL